MAIKNLKHATALLVLLVLIACHKDGSIDPQILLPEVVHSSVSANSHNVLSAVVSAKVRHSDSAHVEIRAVGEARPVLTPASAVAGDSAKLAVLGLRPQTDYALKVIVHSGGKTASGPALSFRTGVLPADLPTFGASGAASGYVLFAADPYAIAIDNTGTVVWYRKFPNGLGLNIQAQGGRYLTRPPSFEPGIVGTWLELDPAGDITRTRGCERGLQPRFHDLLLEGDGSHWIMCDETRDMDLSEIGGVASARVTGTVIQRISADGALLFEWSPFDHFEITDLPVSERSGTLVNWTHGNALTLDNSGNLLVSFRSLNEITKIDTRTARVIWRMGGVHNEFTFRGTPAPPFARQHGLRMVGANEFVMLDNAGDPTQTRAERYVLDEPGRRAELVSSYGSNPPIATLLGGTVQQLPGGKTLVSFGSAGRVEEYDALGNVAWRLEKPGYVFRAQRIVSLYQPGVGTDR